jgi:glycerophosphoryl diester phosphodiesterase
MFVGLARPRDHPEAEVSHAGLDVRHDASVRGSGTVRSPRGLAVAIAYREPMTELAMADARAALSSGGRLPLGFAHRGGALTRSDQNTLPAFAASVRQGATALESDVSLTADGVPVLSHPRIRDRLGRSIGSTRRRDLRPSIPSLEDLYRECGGALDLALDITTPNAVAAVVSVARRRGDPTRLWLTYWRLATMAAWRVRYPDVKLVFPTMLPLRTRADDRGLARLSGAGVDAVNLYHRVCSARRVERIHAQGMLAFSWGPRTGAAAARTLRTGADGVFCDDTAGMVSAVDAERRRRGLPTAAAES